MTWAEVALIITAVGALVSAIASSTAVIIGALNARKLNQVHTLTNSLAERAEAGARATGNLTGRAEQTAERKAEKNQ